MKIGLIIYSQSGNTRLVAERLERRLAGEGHEVFIEEVKIRGKVPAQPGKYELISIPDPGPYDALVFGAPVQAFALNPVMKSYLERIHPLDGKKTALFVTKQVPLLRMGGTGAVETMRRACRSKGGRVCATAIVVWAEKHREKTIARCVETLARIAGNEC